MDAESFARRVEGMQGALYRVTYGLLLNWADCADAVQEALLRAWEKRASLREERYFETWLTRILINECYAVLRRRKTALPIDALPEPAAPPDADPALHDAIARLDEKLRLPIVLYYMEGYAVKDIARMLRLPAGTVKTRLARARALLRLQLSDEYDLSEGRKL